MNRQLTEKETVSSLKIIDRHGNVHSIVITCIELALGSLKKPQSWLNRLKEAGMVSGGVNSLIH